VAKNPDHYAIVVGIDRYAQLPNLRTAVKDAAEFARWLSSDTGGGLPKENVAFIVSTPPLPAHPFDARPTQSEIDEALTLFGIEEERRIGKRLYFYFAGHGFGPQFDDVGMLMAPASMDKLVSISLRAYRQFLSESGAFNELVFILDCSRVQVDANEPATVPSLPTPKSEKPFGTSEFILMSMTDAETSNEAGSEGRGLLTRAALDGLNGESVDASGRVTAESLSSYVRWRVPKLAGGASLRHLPEILLPTQEIVFKDAQVEQQSQGILIVEVPHWAVEVHVYDNLLRPVAETGKVKEEPQPGLYCSETRLSPGIYQVEVALEGKSKGQFVSVSPNQTTRISRDHWGDLKLESAAPLEGTATTHEWHMGPAVEWSHKSTWGKAPGGLSRLFMFVRTTEPHLYPRFAAGLRLLDADLKLVTDFSDSSVQDSHYGWMAFCADLPPGFYVLRRGRSGVWVRHQPLYLCANWETQLFLNARRSPSLRTLTLNMARRDAGFHPEDQTAIAAEAVLDSMRYGTSSSELVTGEKLNALLRGKFENPWLGILAAYALRSNLETTEGVLRSDADPMAADLLRQVMTFLSQEIKDHPDVRALRLDLKVPSEQPFAYPPLLYAGLKMVQRHATSFSETIPLGSLTDRLLDNLLVNSPWTAWRHLEPDEHTKIEDVASGRRRKRSPTKEATRAFSTSAASFLQSVAPKAPVFQFIESEIPADADQGQPGDRVKTPELTSATAASMLYHANLINIGKELTQNYNVDDLPQKVPLNLALSMNDLLDKIDPGEVSQKCGLPLSRAEHGLQHLRSASATTEAGPVGLKAGANPLSATEQVVLEYALQQSAQPDKSPDETSELQQSAGGEADEAVAADPASMTGAAEDDVPKATARPPLTIEGCCGKIRAEADRILLSLKERPVDDSEQARGLAERLQRVANHLLRQAAFTLMTDAESNVLTANGAFYALISPPDVTQDKETQQKVKQDNLSAWLKAFKSAPLGRSKLTNPRPAEDALSGKYILWRTAIEDETAKSVQAHLNVMRVEGVRAIKPETLKEINKVLPKLRLYTPLYVYETTEQRSKYFSQLEEIIEGLERINDTDEAKL
jgi:hypothetical protein